MEDGTSWGNGELVTRSGESRANVEAKKDDATRQTLESDAW